MFDVISGLDDNDYADVQAIDGDGFDDSYGDDTEFRYGASQARCWDYDDDF